MCKMRMLIRIRTQTSIFGVFIVPADGTTAATAGNGNFGTSPFFGQLTDKPLLAFTCLNVVPEVTNNSDSKIKPGTPRPSDPLCGRRGSLFRSKCATATLRGTDTDR